MTLNDPTVLSEREKVALRLLLVGHDAKSVANTLGLSVHTVNDRLRDARRKLDVSSSREAARRLGDMERDDPNCVGAKEIGAGTTAFLQESDREPASPRSSGPRLMWLTGGMLIMSLIIAAAAISAIGTRNDTQATAQTAPIPASGPAATAASTSARTWATLVDDGQWDESWQSAGTMFKEQITAAKWAMTIEPVRKPLGQALSRTLQSAMQSKTLPGAPAGDYQVLQFQTHFANKPNAIETIVLAHETTGWRVNGYFIR